jgi:GcrA cell cycle regulator
MTDETGHIKIIYRTAERFAIIVRDWPSDIPVADILATLNATPGPKPVEIAHIRKWAARAHLARNPDASRAQRRASWAASRDWPRPVVDRKPDLDVDAVLRRIAKPGWEFEKLKALVDLWREGVKTAEIARRIGVTKNAMVGKSHRLMAEGLIEPRGNPVSYGMEPRARKVPAPVRVTPAPFASAYQKPRAGQALPPVAMTIPVIVPRPVFAYVPPRHVPPPRPPPGPVFSRAVRLFGQVKNCQWPHGNPGTKTFRFCEAVSEPGRPYCEEHVKVAYVKVRDRREEAA